MFADQGSCRRNPYLRKGWLNKATALVACVVTEDWSSLQNLADVQLPLDIAVFILVVAAQGGFKMTPGWHGPQDGQGIFARIVWPEAREMAPRWPQRWLQDCCKMAPMRPQDGTKMAQECYEKSYSFGSCASCKL